MANAEIYQRQFIYASARSAAATRTCDHLLTKVGHIVSTDCNLSHILVVDDDPAVREVAVSSLESLGYRMLAAANGPAALGVNVNVITQRG